MGFGSDAGAGPERFREMVRRLAAVRAWPGHPWSVHRVVSMFELLPALYLQARGATTPKWRSFQEASADFGREWWPYEVLADVRDRWPRAARPGLTRAALALRNPWLAVALWRRLPEEAPEPVRASLDERLLEGLQRLAHEMEARLP